MSWATVKRVFKSSRLGSIAGCFVEKGCIKRCDTLAVKRNGEQIYVGPMSSLRRFTKNVDLVCEDFACGITLGGFGELQEGDELHVVSS